MRVSRTRGGRAECSTPDPLPCHGHFELLHAEMLDAFARWRDEFCERRWGVKLSAMQEVEALLARYDAMVEEQPDNLVVKVELTALRATYREKYLPVRQAMSEAFLHGRG